MLWDAVLSGDIDMIVSDHSPCTPDLKLPGEKDFMSAWGGISSLQFGRFSFLLLHIRDLCFYVHLLLSLLACGIKKTYFKSNPFRFVIVLDPSEKETSFHTGEFQNTL